MSTATIEERVRRGAALLDREKPGWARRIIDEELDLGSCRDCILGQVFGAYDRGCEGLSLDGSGDQIVFHGFDVYAHSPPDDLSYTTLRQEIDVEAEYAALAVAWLAEIRARLVPPVPTADPLHVAAMVNCPEMVP